MISYLHKMSLRQFVPIIQGKTQDQGSKNLIFPLLQSNIKQFTLISFLHKEKSLVIWASPLQGTFWHQEKVVGDVGVQKGFPKPHFKHPNNFLHDQGSSPFKMPKYQCMPPHHQALTPLGDVMPLGVTFFLSQEKRLACGGQDTSFKSSSRTFNFYLPHRACGPLASNLWACSPMEAQARLVLPKLSTNQVPQRQMSTPSKDLKS